MYGGGFDMLADARRENSAVRPIRKPASGRRGNRHCRLVRNVAAWTPIGGPFTGLLALVLLAACPLYYGHMFINAKDGPFAAVTMIALLGIVRALQEYPRATPPTLALCGVGIGLAVGTRVLGGFVVMAALLSLAYSSPPNGAGDGFRSALTECGRFLSRLFRPPSSVIW